MSGEYQRDDTNGDAASPAPYNGSSAPGSPGGDIPNGAGTALSKAVDDVMYSDIGINTLLNRLKQSIASARDFAQFLKKRSALEEEQAKGLKRLAAVHLDDVKRSDKRGGSYAMQLSEILKVHERMADNGMQFALSLHQMHEDLDVLSANMERGRKQWKHEGLDAEKKASDAEQAMQKAKARYNSLAEDYDRAKTGDTKGRKIGLRGPKSGEQYEQDLLRKSETADTDFKDKVRQAQTQREQLIKADRPKAVRALQELIKECDSALTLQMQKFATFNEKLLLGNGLAVTPFTANDAPQKSMRDLVSGIDNDTDFHTYVAGHSGKVPRPAELKYEQHPTLAPKTQAPRAVSAATPSQTTQPPLTVNTSTSQPASTATRYGAQPQTAQPPSSTYSQPASAGYALQQGGPQDLQTPSYATHQSPYSAQPSASERDTNYSTPPYPVNPSERAPSSGFGQQTTGIVPAAAPVPQIAPNHSFSPTGSQGRVFGVSLEDLFARDQSAVPIIVFQCIQAVDMFGLDTEGIYRHNGNQSHVHRLRDAFDNMPPNSPQLDFRNPSNFYHDVNAVASLLKHFFRELPDPLFTRAGYANFIGAAKQDDENARRDGLHQAINDLPDANYATLRAVVLHLGRVMQNESRTRMTAENLAVCFA